MKSGFRLIYLALLIAVAVPSALQAAPVNVEQLWDMGMKYLSDNNPAKAADCGRRLQSCKNDPKAQIYADIILGQSAIINDDYAKAYKYLRSAELSQEGVANDSVRASIYNGLGLYEINAEQDFNKALEYFFAGLDYTKKSNYESLYAIILNNISGVYYLKKDPSGLEYALECTEIGRKRKNRMLTLAGAQQTAMMYLLRNDLDQAHRYAQEALEIARSESNLNYVADMCLTAGEIANRRADYSAALAYFREAEQKSGLGQEVKIRALLGSALALKGEGRYDQAMMALTQALQTSDKFGIALFRPDILLAISDIYELQGNMKNALEYHRKYSQSLDSLGKERNEKLLQEARAKFDLERKDNELNLQKMDNLRRQRTMYLLLAILVLITGAALALLVMNHRRNRFYKVIVAQNNQAMRLEAELRQRISEMEGQLAKREQPTERGDVKYGSSSLSQDKSREILQRLEEAMQTGQVFRDPSLTKDKLASMLQTNRSYLSQIINEHYNQSFTQYVNSFRLREAVRLLSEPSCDMALKQICADLGFSSMSTFYSQFKESTGMTPNVYRRQALSNGAVREQSQED